MFVVMTGIFEASSGLGLGQVIVFCNGDRSGLGR